MGACSSVLQDSDRKIVEPAFEKVTSAFHCLVDAVDLYIDGIKPGDLQLKVEDYVDRKELAEMQYDMLKRLSKEAQIA